MLVAEPAPLAAPAARRAQAAAAASLERGLGGVPRGPGRPVPVASERGGSGPAAPAAEGAALLAGAAAAACCGRRRRRRGRGAGGGARRCDARLPRRVGPELPSVLHTVVGKRELKGTIAWVLEKHGPERTVKILERLKESGFAWATRGAVSLGIDDLVVPPSKSDLNDGAQHRAQEADMKARNGDITVVEKFLKVTDEWKTASESVKDAAMTNFKENDPNNPVYMMSASGARGNVSQVRQLLAQRGLMADATGQIIDVPIKHCLREGMTASDMLVSSNGARKGMIDTALGTADSGYLYRRLDFAASSQVIRRTDCGTEKAVAAHFHGMGNKPASLKERIRGRVLARAVVEPKTGEVMYEKGHLLRTSEAQHVDRVWKKYDLEGIDLPPIWVRSTLACEAPDGICARCYGEDMSKPGQLVSLGTPVGTIAGQSMGEPGTQLTMRTFHTGGAFEGGAFKGTQAAGPGTISLVDSSGDPVVATGGPGQGLWSRTPHGDTACTLALGAELRVEGADGGVIQEESIMPGARVRVQHGERVTLGQVLFETPPRKAPSSAGAKTGKKEKEVEVEKLPKPILADESGEVFVTEVEPGAPGCVPDNSQLVWVLQGCCVQFQSAPECALTVRPGDIVEYGTPLAVEWATTPCAGVPRLQLWQPRQAAAAPGTTGWRQFDWHQGVVEDASAAVDNKDPGNEEFSLRVDFDEAASLCGLLSEYHAVFDAPAALKPEAPAARRRKSMRSYKTMKIGPVETAPSVSVLAHRGPPAEAGEQAPPEISLSCAAPAQGAGSVVNPVCRRIHPGCVVPLGGLVFVLPCESGGQRVLWSPEEVHRLCLPREKLQILLEEQLQFHYAGTALPTHATHISASTSRYSPLLTTSTDGLICLYRPTGDSGDVRVVDEGAGVLRRECWDRAVGGQSPEENFEDERGRLNRTVECVIKPSAAMAVPKHLIDDSWYSAARDGGGGVHLHQKLVPPGTSFLPGKPSLKSEKDWWVVELLEDPDTAKAGICWLAIRPVRRFEIPAVPEPAPPHAAKAASFWHVPFVNGEVVASLSPVALAHEVTLSLGRSPSEPHCVTAALDEAWPAYAGRPAAADAVRPAAADAGSQRKPGGARLELVRDSVQGRLRVVQHSPPGPPSRGSGRGGWQEAPASYMDFQRSPGSSSSTSPGPRSVPQRTLPSPADGLVCRADVGERNSSVVVIRQEDCARVPCKSRPTVALGALVRRGDALSAEDEAPCAGQVLSVEEQGDGFLVTLRKGHVYLVTEGGSVLMQSGSLAEKGDLLGTVDLAVPKTADIVQGLPKINSMFEAATKTGLKERLDELWEEAKKEHRGVEAAKVAVRAMQVQLAADIQSVYLEQGVSINSKHIEIVVRQMTGKCEVVHGAGLLQPGSLVSYLDVEAAQALRPSGDIVVRPVIRGITTVGLDNHVLVGMGFREVDNVLLKDLVQGPVLHPLSGIKENLMIGKAIDAGTNVSVSI